MYYSEPRYSVSKDTTVHIVHPDAMPGIMLYRTQIQCREIYSSGSRYSIGKYAIVNPDTKLGNILYSAGNYTVMNPNKYSVGKYTLVNPNTVPYRVVHIL